MHLSVSNSKRERFRKVLENKLSVVVSFIAQPRVPVG